MRSSFCICDSCTTGRGIPWRLRPPRKAGGILLLREFRRYFALAQTWQDFGKVGPTGIECINNMNNI
jgi:hypothetical protein